MKTVSVILTTYNAEKFISETVQSITSQIGINKDFELELIIVDDCSTDRTTQFLKGLGITPLSTRINSGGPNMGRNIGLKLASGDFICIADHDDLWNPDRIKQLLPYFDKAPILTSGYTLIDVSTGHNINRCCDSSSGYKFYDKNITFITKLTKSLTGQKTYLGSIFFTSKLKSILFEEEFGFLDFDWILKLFHENKSLEVCAPLYKRIVEGKNLSLNYNYRLRDFEYSKSFIKRYEKEFPKEVALGTKRIYGSRARYFYLIGNMKEARRYFRKSELNLKTFAYYLTTYAGANLVKKKYNVFG